ncbi:MAG TPA: hypothetical protein VN285_06740 [Candidatus Deferrimicrobium sp.]|nr:hypothetical protein [Candidatus Deferrimicrobium sp.]
MPERNPTDTREITFAQELMRKATHMGAMVIPIGYQVLQLDKSAVLMIMVLITAAMVLTDVARLRQWWFWRSFARPVISPLIRHHELAGDFTGATYILLSVCFTVALFEKQIAIAALAYVIVGDTFAALVGRRWGRHRFGRKSLEGSAACLLATAIAAFLVPGLPARIGLFGALIATAAEAAPLGVDDNVSIPLLSGLAMALLSKTL